MIHLDGKSLTLAEVERVVFGGEAVAAAPEALVGVSASAELVEKIVSESRPVYGINTGFGKMSTQTIPKGKLKELQINLLRSHSAGVGEPLPDAAARAALLFRLNSLLMGRSGVRPILIEYLTRFLNEGVIPVIPSKGSVGSSGDLAPLAHMALLVIGEGEAKWNDLILTGAELLAKLDLKPLELAPKEGLALINGTQIMLAVGFMAWRKAHILMDNALMIASMGLEAAGGHTAALDERLQDCHPHPGHREAAKRVRDWVHGSGLVNHSPDVQDAYSLRCIPQVLGSCIDSLDFVQDKIEIEMNSTTDNPLLFVETGEAISGGNFHGEAMALAFEQLCMALSEMGNFSERRTALLLDRPDLPLFLVEEGGLNSGLMIVQYTAAALVSENKILSHPAVVDSIPTSAGKEDHNSLGSISARKAYEIAKNVEYILAIELLTASQAISFRVTSMISPRIKNVYDRLRAEIPPVTEDRVIHHDICRLRDLIASYDLISD
ncbi:histidine ammonia-lyase [Candidatus Acetothermia bacterium]|nr:histidine ammonia-lyase [Candidatus Acetothermia bacterium]MBI3643534.1 histidine ammonia-lyase [Candidatus Acetothermia bacterium]